MFRSHLAEPLVMFATVVQWLVLSLLTGVVVGTVCSLFLRVLFTTEGNVYAVPWWLQASLLVGGGLANGLLLYFGYRNTPDGLRDSPVVAVHDQQGRMPLRTLWVKPVAALITLSCGGSAGKEGPCSHVGASFASMIGKTLHLNAELRKRLVACGVSAGFASVFGTPIGGAIYGVEMLAIGRIRHDFLFPGIVAGVTAFRVSEYLGVPYPQYQIAFVSDYMLLLFIKILIIGIFCGIFSWVFVELLRLTRRCFALVREQFGLWLPIMPLLGGVLLALILLFAPSDYLGLSLPVMHQALQGGDVPYTGFLWKILFVAITLGSGFYGGIVTPQFVIGALLGGALGPLLGLSPAMGAAAGFVAVVASASNAPVAAIIMGVELFGADATLYVAGACVAAYLIIGHRSVYPAQRMAFSKSSWLHANAGVPVSQEKTHLSYGLLRWWSERRHRRHSGDD